MPVSLARVEYRPMDSLAVKAWAARAGAGCVLFADDLLAADSMKRAVLELSFPAGLKCHAGVIEDMVVRLEDGEFDLDVCVIFFPSAANALRAVVSGLRLDRLSVPPAMPDAAGEGGERGEEERYALSRLAKRGVKVETSAGPDEPPEASGAPGR